VTERLRAARRHAGLGRWGARPSPVSRLQRNPSCHGEERPAGVGGADPPARGGRMHGSGSHPLPLFCCRDRLLQIRDGKVDVPAPADPGVLHVRIRGSCTSSTAPPLMPAISWLDVDTALSPRISHGTRDTFSRDLAQSIDRSAGAVGADRVASVAARRDQGGSPVKQGAPPSRGGGRTAAPVERMPVVCRLMHTAEVDGDQHGGTGRGSRRRAPAYRRT